MTKFLFVSLFIAFCSLFFAPAAQAAANPALPASFQDRIDSRGQDQNANIDKFSKENFESLGISLGCAITGCTTSEGEVTDQGAIPTASKFLAFMITTPPVQSSHYIANLLDSVGVPGVKPAYAQGIGFTSLTPVLNVWKAFRNVAYFFFIIIFVVVGFMIMFRARLDAQTVVTVQAALPKMVLTLILITFSYAIAGFVVDLIYLSIFLFTGVLETAGLLSSAVTARNALFGFSIFRIGFSFLIAPLETAGSAANAVSAVASGLFGIPNWWITDGIIDIIAYVIISIAIIIALFRTLLSLLFAYIGIIIAVVFAPIQLLLNALPNSQTFTGWLKGLVANAAVFPAVAIMVLVGAALVGTNSAGEDVTGLGIAPTQGAQGAGFGFREGSGFVPPLITSRGTGLGANQGREEFGVEHVKALIGLGIIMLLPEVAKLIKEMFGVKSELGELIQANLRYKETVNMLLGKSPEEEFKQRGWLRRFTIPGTARIPGTGGKGITIPGFTFK
ncbi:hypothetical protein A2783_01710 [Microgenomates group bacterium RIFCSPHIGHO2_01_FULL_45_11]|nr:MAG: hypothetical protein A2783_01710 [Microgenomates group bacterium RIFCSPHIGHO2_01_FULL_45_11]